MAQLDVNTGKVTKTKNKMVALVWVAALFAIISTSMHYLLVNYVTHQRTDIRTVVVRTPDGSMKVIEFNCVEHPAAAACSDLKGFKY